MPASARRATNGEDVAGAALGDDVEQRDELVLGHETQRLAHAGRP